MKKEWALAELLETLPRVRREAIAIMSCAEPSAGQGRCVREESGRKEYADVSLRASPASCFSLERLCDWPEGVGAEEGEALDRALLWGIAEGTVRMGKPAWGCRIECLAADFSPGERAVAAVRTAACLAVQNAVDNGQWTVTVTARRSSGAGLFPRLPRGGQHPASRRWMSCESCSSAQGRSPRRRSRR